MDIAILKLDLEFKTGNKSLDLQHHDFAELINKVTKSLLETKNFDDKQKLLYELVEYTTFHFSSEEKTAKSFNLVGLNLHGERHTELLDELHRNINDLLEGRYSTEEFISFLHSWFIGHTVYEDGNFFRGEYPS